MKSTVFLSIFYLIVFTLSLSLSISYAQNIPANGEAPFLGTVKGQVVDAQSNVAVEYATITLVSLRDTTKLLGALADEKGNFEIEQVKPGKYLVKISFIGYKNYRSDTLRINPRTPNVNLGQIKIKPNTQMLQDVKVVGEREQMQMSIDKKVFEVDKNPIVAGGSASDVLQQIPSVTVDTDGNINMRGTGNVTIWVNGKPYANAGSAQQILQQIPAGNIEKVELITNPSARYDAEGMGGIINIILKKNREDGMNGLVSSGFGTRDSRNESFDKQNTINKYNGNASLNWKVGKWNFSTNYGYRYGQRWQRHKTFRENKFTNDTSNFQNQESRAELFTHNHLGSIGAEYTIDKKNTIDARFTGGYNENAEPELILYDFENNTPFRSSLYRNRDVRQYHYGYNTDFNLSYRRTFDVPTKELYVAGTASYSTGYGTTNFFQKENTINNLTNVPIEVSRTRPFNENMIYQGQIDFVQPVSEKARFELGAKFIHRNFDNNFRADSFSTVFFSDTARTNRFRYYEYVNAAYAIWNQQLPKGFAVQAGLRAEQTIRTIEQVTINQTNRPNDLIDFFPTIHLTKKLPKEQEMRASYSRRINRPNPGTLNPFPTYNDPINLVRGNPFLKPEYVDSYELSYSKNWEKHSFIATGYFRQINGTTQRVRSVDVNTGVSVTEYTNVGYARNTGLELIGKNTFTKWWNITSNINAFYAQIVDVNNPTSNLNRENLTGNGRLQSNFKVWKGADFQISGYYMMPIAIAQGTFFGMNGIDVGFKKDIIPQKAFLTINISDVFNTRQFNAIQEGPNFYTEIKRKRETRVMTVNFTYKFGNESLTARKSSRRQSREGQGGGGEGVDF